MAAGRSSRSARAGSVGARIRGRDAKVFSRASTAGLGSGVHVVYAHAASAAGEIEKYRAAYDQAVAAIDAVSSNEERRIVASTFSHVPKPLDPR